MAITNFIPELWCQHPAGTPEEPRLRFRREPRLRGRHRQLRRHRAHHRHRAHQHRRLHGPHRDITIEPATDKDAGELVINQSKYFAFEIDDVEKRQP